jgi:hypothetical protein
MDTIAGNKHLKTTGDRLLQRQRSGLWFKASLSKMTARPYLNIWCTPVILAYAGGVDRMFVGRTFVV